MMGKLKKNECRDEKVAAVKLTHALHLIFIFFEFWSSYGIIIHLYGHNNSPEILLINQFWFEIQRISSTTRLLLRENNSQQYFICWASRTSCTRIISNILYINRQNQSGSHYISVDGSVSEEDYDQAQSKWISSIVFHLRDRFFFQLSIEVPCNNFSFARRSENGHFFVSNLFKYSWYLLL